MALTIGSQVGAFKINSLLGVGGMGEVYRALDTRLNREVALKVLPSVFTEDFERVSRLRREAQVLAALNHPNIAMIHGLEEQQGFIALALELVEGEDLAQRLKRGPVSLEEALSIARQIGEGLEAAHEKGIVHRDLKPANVKITPDSRVKVLDFGLARVGGTGTAGSESFANSPTISLMATQAGVILGTASYMSPEQARGMTADHRADIFSLGVVLYEMLAGQTPFKGDTVSDVLASVLAREPDLQALPADLSPRLLELLRRCLEKDPKRRWQAIGDVRYELERIAERPTELPASTGDVEKRSPWRSIAPWLAAAVTGAVVGIGFWLGFAPGQPAPGQVIRLSVDVPEVWGSVAVSPKGDLIAFTTPSGSGGIVIRPLSSFDATLIAEGTKGIGKFLFTPDGQWVVFAEARGLGTFVLQRVPVGGGIPLEVARFEVPVTGLSWSGEDLIVTLGTKGIFKVSGPDGSPEQLVAPEPGEQMAAAQILPGGEDILFTSSTRPTGDWSTPTVALHSLKSGERKVVIPAGTDGRYFESGHIAFFAGGVLLAAPFSLEEKRLTGAPVPAIEGVRREYLRGQPQAGGFVSVSETGTLVYVPGPVTIANYQSRIAMVDRSGVETLLDLPVKPYESPRISPDGKRLAVSTNSDEEAAVWVLELADQSAPRRLTFTGKNRLPVWSPDGTRLAFQSDREGDIGIFVQNADGTGQTERLTKAEPGTVHIPESWSKDGRFLSFSVLEDGGGTLWLYSFTEGKASRFEAERSVAPLNSAFSPDGKWIVYGVRGGMQEGRIYLQPVPSTGALYLVSEGSGHHPFWAPDGKEIFYITFALVSAPIELDPVVKVGKQSRVELDLRTVHTGQSPLNYDITPDGRQFVLPRTARESERSARAGGQVGEILRGMGPFSQSPLGDLSPEETVRGAAIRVVLNWFEELKTLAPPDR